MARLNSFHIAPEAWPDSGQASLRGSEAHHLSRVLRHKPGDKVRLFDGQGRWGLFELLAVTKKEATLHLIEQHESPIPKASLTLALGWNKSNRRDWLLEKSVELQAGGVVFWQSHRSQGKVPSEPKGKWIDRTIQAAKQCGSNWLPKLKTCQSMNELIKFADGFDTKLLLWESGKNIELLTPVHLSSGNVLAVVGPEGGLEDHEAGVLIQNGFAAVTLGDSILRWETAALHCLSLSFFAHQT